MNLTEKSAHLAWCALVALALARQNGDVVSPVQENLFLTRWLATALKQRRFSRDVAPDIEWLLKQGRQLGVNAKLARKLNGTVAKLAMRQPFVLFKGLTFQKLCLPGAFRPGDHHNKMLRPGLCVVHASPQYL